jgi:hypothetical protein
MFFWICPLRGISVKLIPIKFVTLSIKEDFTRYTTANGAESRRWGYYKYFYNLKKGRQTLTAVSPVSLLKDPLLLTLMRFI